VTSRPIDPDSLADLASRALKEGGEEDAAPILDSAARAAGNNARLWQWSALLDRALDQHGEALKAFANAARLAPDDASIAHGHARVALEAGLDARTLFDQALKLGPNGDVLLGHAAAQYAMGEGEAAALELAAILDRNALWALGHVQWAQLSSMIGRPEAAATTIDRALAAHPQNVPLWLAALQILTSADRHAEAWRRADAAIAATGQSAPFGLTRAAGLSDAGELAMAVEAFTALGEPRDIHHAVRLARHQVRAGDWNSLNRLADRWMQGDDAHLFWPYASIAWRRSGDLRWNWLEGDDRLIQVYDLGSKLSSLDALARRLRALHQRSGRFLDQSVRGGTQTDGPLLSRIDPEIRALRTAIVEAVEQYRSTLPPVDPTHPMLRHPRDGRVRFAGSWSVRLESAGFHNNHVHPQGWISSAFYVAVPESLSGEEGWLTLGEPQAGLGSGIPPIRRIEPKPGHLVLFPSMMWHGTLPFTEGERLTVAFDVAPPR
jgi:tetratricopeptide (TPR) repeat protein